MFIERNYIGMIDITIQFLLEIIDILPFLIPFILIVNLAADLCFGR